MTDGYKLPREWKVEELRKVIDPKRSIRYGIVQPGDFDPNGRFMVRGQDYSFGWVEPEKLFRVSDAIEERYKNARLKAGDIILTIVGAGTGTVAIVPDWLEGANMTQTTARIAIDPSIASSNYCYYLLESSYGKRLTYTNIKGGAQPGLNCGDIEQYEIPLPPLAEQTAIANLLSTWDRAITLTTRLIAQKELQKKWLMRELLSGRRRLKGFKGTWNEVKLADLFNRVTRRNAEGNTNVVTISAQRGFVRQDDFFNKMVASDITESYFLVHRGEFCYNKSYSNGYPWGATKRLNDFDKAVVTTLYICFSLKDETGASGDFFEQYFESGILDRGLMRIAHEGGRAHGLLNVTPGDFFALRIAVPDLAEQEAIARVLRTADVELNQLRLKLGKLKEQKKGLMQALLTGKRRILSASLPKR